MKNMISINFTICIVLAFFFFPAINSQSEQTQTNDKTQTIKNITVEEAQILIEKNKDNPNLIILDVRTSDEYMGEHIEDAINIDFYSDTFREDLNKLDKEKVYIVHCQAGGRSSKALDIMNGLGFKEAYNMGGIRQWKEKGLPTTTK